MDFWMCADGMIRLAEASANKQKSTKGDCMALLCSNGTKKKVEQTTNAEKLDSASRQTCAEDHIVESQLAF